MKKRKNAGNSMGIGGNLLTAGAIVGTALSLSVDDVAAQKNDSYDSLIIDTKPFELYEPNAGKNVEVKDNLLDDYLSVGVDGLEIYNDWYARQNNNRKINPGMDNPRKFGKAVRNHISDMYLREDDVKAVFPEVKRGRVRKRDLKSLSVNDAIYLSGLITADKLEYYQNMVKEKEGMEFSDDTQMKVLQIFLDAYSGIDRRNSEARRIDSMSIDEVFYEGDGVCRNYAPLNAEIFNVLKKGNKKLENTYMKPFTPEDLAHHIFLSHAWNKVETVKEKNGRLVIETTYVDPTWLDTRRDSVQNPVDAYNALDESHFGRGSIHAAYSTAYLLDFLSSRKRNREMITKDKYFLTDEQLEAYRGQSFNGWLNVCNEIIDLKDADSSGPYKSLFTEAFGKAVSKITDNGLVYYDLFECGDCADGITENEMEKLDHIYRRALETNPRYVNTDGIMTFNESFDLMSPSDIYNQIMKLNQ